jgi:hypothetical protein
MSERRLIALLIGSVLLISTEPSAQILTKGQQNCVNAMNKNLQKVAATAGKSGYDCIKNFAKGKTAKLGPDPTVEGCLTADVANKVADAEAKTKQDFDKRCTGSDKSGFSHLPPYGVTDPNTVNTAATQKELDLFHDIFGSDLDSVVSTEAGNKEISKCQQAVVKSAAKCQDTKLKQFNKCKKSGLKDESIQSFLDLQDCMGQDPKGKIAKACDPVAGKIQQAIGKCGTIDLSDTFPGCDTDDPSTLATCLDQVVECQVCLALNRADSLERDCDQFDDGLLNGSCFDQDPELGPMIAGRSSYVDGTFVWTDYPLDDRGANTLEDPPRGCSPGGPDCSGGDETYPEWAAPGNAADLIQLQIGETTLGQRLRVRAVLGTLVDPEVPILGVGFDTDSDAGTDGDLIRRHPALGLHRRRLVHCRRRPRSAHGRGGSLRQPDRGQHRLGPAAPHNGNLDGLRCPGDQEPVRRLLARRIGGNLRPRIRWR